MSNRQRRRAIVMVCDRLGSGFLGPYGNTWLETPEFNRLASEGLVLEQVIVDALDLPSLYNSLWWGSHAAFGPAAGQHSVIAELAAASAEIRLVTDELQVAEHAGAADFCQVDRLASTPPEQLCDQPEETALARLCAMAISQWLDSSPDLLWVHARAMEAAWDAPYAMREQFRDDEDPPTPSEATPPSGPVPTETDPDVLQGWLWAYAAQVSLLDLCLEPICELWRQADDPTLLIILGARGYALGEHGYWGDSDGPLHSERIQVPLLIASNDLQLAHIRSQSLVQPADVAATLRDWFQTPWTTHALSTDAYSAESTAEQRPRRSLLRLVEERWDPASAFARPLAVARQGSQWALRTPAWLACLDRSVPSNQGPATCELYLKPDDRWDVSNVADRAESVAQGFLGLATSCETLGPGSSVEDLPPLDPLLIEPPE